MYNENYLYHLQERFQYNEFHEQNLSTMQAKEGKEGGREGMSYYNDDYYDAPSDYACYYDEYAHMGLCLICDYLDDTTCLKYPGLPDYFFGRKRKCKHFKELGSREVGL